MKFLADECCDAELFLLLRSQRYYVLYVTEFKPGALDEEVLKKAFSEKRILFTKDKNFGELVYRLKKVTQRINKIIVLSYGMSRKCQSINFWL